MCNGKKVETMDLWGFESRKRQRKPEAQILRGKYRFKVFIQDKSVEYGFTA